MDGAHSCFGNICIDSYLGCLVEQSIIKFVYGIEFHITALITMATYGALAYLRWHWDESLIGTLTLHLMQDATLCAHYKLLLV